MTTLSRDERIAVAMVELRLMGMHPKWVEFVSAACDGRNGSELETWLQHAFNAIKAHPAYFSTYGDDR